MVLTYSSVTSYPWGAPHIARGGLYARKVQHFRDFSAIRKMADFQLILAALLSPDNETRNQAEVGARNKVFSVAAHETVSH